MEMIDISEIEKLEFRVSEIYISIQGEGLRAGKLCTFVRLHGCMLRCTWCDTPYALDIKKGGELMTGKEIIDSVINLGCDFVEFTGGEPLQQTAVIPLMKYFCDEGYTVAIETNGHCSIAELDERVVKIMDLKCPGSKMSKFNNYENIEYLRKGDEVKFVIMNKEDYEWAKDKTLEYDLCNRVGAVIFSPVFGEIEAKELAEWIIEDRLCVRLQLQMHKFIWAPDTRGV